MKAKPTYQDLEVRIRDLEHRIEELESSNSLLESIFTNLPIGIQVFDKEGFSKKINNKQREMLGLTDLEEGMINYNILTDAYSKVSGLDNIYRKALKGEVINYQNEIDFDLPEKNSKKHRGKRQFQETIFPIFSSKRKVISVVAMLNDITEKKETEKKLLQSEENFRAFFNTTNDFLFVLDEKGSIITANKTVYDRLNYTEKEINGESVLMVHPEERREEAAQIVFKMLMGEASFCPIPLVTKKGRYIPVETRVIKGIWNGKPAIFGVSKDISDLRLSEEKFSKFFQINPGLCSVSIIETGEYVEVNETFLSKLGFTYQEVIGKTSIELNIITSETRKALSKLLGKEGKANGLETTLNCKNGKILNVLLFAENIFIQEKLFRFTIALDVTELKQTEKKLLEREKELSTQNSELEALNDEYSRITLSLQENLIALQQAKDLVEENEVKFRTLFDSSPDPVFIVEKGTGLIFDLNEKSVEKYGYLPEQLIGKKNSIVSAEPDKTDEFALNPLDFVPIRYHKKSNGEIFPVEISTSSIRIQNKDYFFSNIRDITERIKAEHILKESEQRFRSIFDNAISGIAFSDTNQNLLMTNRALDKMFGYEKGELVGFNIDDLLHPDDIPLNNDFFIEQLKKSDEGFKIERRYVTKQKNTIWVDLSGSIIRDFDGNPKYVVGVINNITKKKEAEEKLKELIATKDKLFSIIAHDLKNPFNAILGMSSLLVENVENRNTKQIQDYSKIIHTASQQALNLLENLLDWSRSQSGVLNFKPITFDFQSLLNDTIALFENTANQKGIKIKHAVEPYLKVHADKNMLSTIIRNLISNSIKYSNFEEEVFITAVTYKRMLKFSIADKGVGIPKEKMDDLFKIESQVQTQGTNNEKGTGLGLILCKEFIERHNGEIWVESNVNIGTTFYFTIPKL